ncbi:hypothetical protein NIL11_26945, partial [Klebsiella pneumoniae]|uniref:hypothetical protein n=1 Tax=Klebsiella pneumoniae TaxID=573 RepID=UPI0021F6F55B
MDRLKEATEATRRSSMVLENLANRLVELERGATLGRMVEDIVARLASPLQKVSGKAQAMLSRTLDADLTV